ncbi:MAG: 2-oxoacid:acceptor oxidoreductase subunit alpha [Chloroherpetonaceae bacterium]|nr:2-oxoacid:acceptor oxidoreductase subunit alpha [Chloroherpetonaceae bacterium]MDW8436681.1 2-oxoacid:acceptor oxidoreductase subunit alpha [Chloroherpetonaceae bacterium]
MSEVHSRPIRVETKQDVTILFAGDSGDGMQLTGTQFSETAAILGNDLNTFPNYPAEIRAPAGTLPGVSGFQVQFGSKEIFTPGDKIDVLVAMNAAALKANLKLLKEGKIIIANVDGFDEKNLQLAGCKTNPLEDGSLAKYHVYPIEIGKLTRSALEGTGLSTKEIDRSKNMFVLGLLFWLYTRPLDHTINNIREKFKKKPEIAEANIKALQAGYSYGEATEIFTTRYEVKKAKLPAGTYRHIMGNQATAYALIAASKKSGLPLFLGSYPITPASDILHELSKHKNFGVRTFQAEDEIAAMCAAIGAAYGGSLAATSTSGPGMDLKEEAIGLAVSLELPVVIIDVQRGGPSTGLPTKTEQSDLLMAMFGRHGESPVPIIAANSPAGCFDATFEACRLAIEFMTPVICLTDGYIANGSEPWKFPTAKDLPDITVKFAAPRNAGDPKYLPYKRNDKGAREWAIPGTKGLEHRIGGLEKQHETGAVSYDAENHALMTKLRAEKIEKIADAIPLQTIDNGSEKGKLLVLGWGSTYGTIKTVVRDLRLEGYDVSHAHLTYLNPFPKNLGELIYNFDKILIPELNSGQLARLIRDKFLAPVIQFNKVQGMPFMESELKEKIIAILTEKEK